MVWYYENGHWLGFDDDTLLYKVLQEDGYWVWDYVPDMTGLFGYDTAEEAMEAAEKDYESRDFDFDEDELIFTDEEWTDILGDIAFTERREQKAGLI